MLQNPAETLCIVMPCYNEACGISNVIHTTQKKLSTLIDSKKISIESHILLVDDGSTDETWSVIEDLHNQYPKLKAAQLAANRGKEYALYAGLMEARKSADIVICMDADLQHDINAIDNFLAKRAEGYELLYGIKKSRGKESFIRKYTAKIFYSLMEMLGSPVKRGHSDYSLMTTQVLDALSNYGESNMMFRALLCHTGFKQDVIYFHVQDRISGQSKMSLSKLFSLSLDAITSFTIAPLRLIAILGCFIFIISLAMITWVIADYINIGTPNGWATLTTSLWFLGGLGMISIGIVGEYIGKIYIETKKRPRFYIKKRI